MPNTTLVVLNCCGVDLNARCMQGLATRAASLVAVVMLCTAVVPVVAHPGHEYKVSGTVSKVRIEQLRVQQFEVTEADGARETFFANPATEVLVERGRGTDADIKIGAAVTVEGVENDRGMIEAKIVRISSSKSQG